MQAGSLDVRLMLMKTEFPCRQHAYDAIPRAPAAPAPCSRSSNTLLCEIQIMMFSKYVLSELLAGEEYLKGQVLSLRRVCQTVSLAF